MKSLLILIFIFCSAAVAPAQVKNVSSEEFRSLMQSKNNAQIIDLRTNDEIKRKGSIRGSRQIDYLSANADSLIATLDKNKPVLVYCAGGGRSSDCAEKMQGLGFREIYNLEKGFDDWARKKFDTELAIPVQQDAGR